MRAGGTVVEVTVLNIFTETTKENEETVHELITKAIENNKNILEYSSKHSIFSFEVCLRADLSVNISILWEKEAGKAGQLNPEDGPSS